MWTAFYILIGAIAAVVLVGIVLRKLLKPLGDGISKWGRGG